MTTAILILLPFVVVWVIASVFYFIARRRALQLRVDELSFARQIRNRQGGVAPASIFNRPRTWLAVKSRNSDEVVRAIGLQQVESCPCGEGVTDFEARRIFVSPSANGWVVISGRQVPGPAEDIDSCFRFLTELSGRVGHLQYFHANPALGHHAWAKIIDDQVVRAYAWTGETVWNQGEFTLAEQKSGLRCFDYGQEAGGDSYSNWELSGGNVDRVPLLARIWSVDPAALLDSGWQYKRGWSGRLLVQRSKLN